MRQATSSKKIAVIYHGECWDGFGGGYSAWKKFGDKAEYFGLKHGDSLPRGLRGKTVYIVDFSFKEPVMKKLIADNQKVIALDHHISAEKSTKMATEYIYDLKHSGAVIAWKYFHPGKATPKLLFHIEDIDLWKFRLSGTRPLMSYMEMVDYDFKIWDKIARSLENPASRRSYIEKGELILKYERDMIERLLEGAEKAKFKGYKTLVVNSPVLHSEIGNALVKKLPPIGIVWSEKNGTIRVSLRSDGKADVSKIAVKYGGGGHKAAAGFPWPAYKNFPWKLLPNS